MLNIFIENLSISVFFGLPICLCKLYLNSTHRSQSIYLTLAFGQLEALPPVFSVGACFEALATIKCGQKKNRLTAENHPSEQSANRQRLNAGGATWQHTVATHPIWLSGLLALTLSISRVMSKLRERRSHNQCHAPQKSVVWKTKGEKNKKLIAPQTHTLRLAAAVVQMLVLVPTQPAVVV